MVDFTGQPGPTSEVPSQWSHLTQYFQQLTRSLSRTMECYCVILLHQYLTTTITSSEFTRVTATITKRMTDYHSTNAGMGSAVL
ncbi:hypothetical protein BaRGS_00014754 [Batillaria attramentaria]|uniref:Uncharacterized protein n=1 Tax=Batillaria attramentaria TaxID=370345 RepID=A0ABD0L4B8_9CAEN